MKRVDKKGFSLLNDELMKGISGTGTQLGVFISNVLDRLVTKGVISSSFDSAIVNSRLGQKLGLTAPTPLPPPGG